MKAIKGDTLTKKTGVHFSLSAWGLMLWLFFCSCFLQKSEQPCGCNCCKLLQYIVFVIFYLFARDYIDVAAASV
jgi:hypothetical protein